MLHIPSHNEEQELYSEYQPLLNSYDHSIFGYEALMRNSAGTSPLVMIEAAREKGALFELDTLAITSAIQNFPKEYLKEYSLFINILPSTIVHPGFNRFIQGFIRQHPITPNLIVFEVNEDPAEESVWKQEVFSERLSFMKSLGFQIALDDLSITNSTFIKMEETAPAFIKLDHTRSKGLASSKEKQELISFFMEFTNKERRLVLEGIETEDDLLTAKKLGVPLLQGYYISKPIRLFE